MWNLRAYNMSPFHNYKLEILKIRSKCSKYDSLIVSNILGKQRKNLKELYVGDYSSVSDSTHSSSLNLAIANSIRTLKFPPGSKVVN